MRQTPLQLFVKLVPEIDKDVRSLVQADDGDRVWTKILRLPPGTYHYRYVVDGEWREDPVNPLSAPGPVGGRNSVLVVR